MKVAFYLDSINPNIDYSDPEAANPGIGGTQFLTYSLSYHLGQTGEIDVSLFVNEMANFPEEMKIEIVRSLEECIIRVNEDNFDYLVIRGPFIQKKIMNQIAESGVKIITWSHNLETFQFFSRLLSPSIVKNICVSNSQRLLLKDSKLFSKSVTILNGINFKDYSQLPINNVKKYDVCYIGNLYPKSGYEDVLKAWPKIKKTIPNANLCIIGGNKLYNNRLNSSYSSKSIKKLKKLEEKINLEFKDSIEYVGVLGGRKKLSKMSESTIGIANITPTGETFGLAAIEFQALGVPVVSINKVGLKETVKSNETGILVNKKKDLADAIISLLIDKDKTNQLSINAKDFVRRNFDIKFIVKDWIVLFNSLPNTSLKTCQSSFSDDDFLEKLTQKNFKIKQNRLLSWLPPIQFYKYVRYIFVRILEKSNII
ncbi:glycosyltransferase [Streptococcus iniae]|uniref:CpsL n=5 Tax=Streptococcus iniae TaxID=1346 RepID=Q2KM63_STRIN|nr:glycosyltransferase family 4 protein [Streptococcus iniae]AGM98623.1 CpsL [Streptococcus iniae SF1]AAY17307.1 CpsL [Streptococcus iniae]AHY15650.1 capsular biosynthesis protein CpsL [Streptococcus iniae]AHY17518.1 capsular biosynthesis protein CpsL [Streptococcus iniae]AJG25820.1 capsular biosynthesis protein CpsL [Streptococcus iniae]